MYRPTIIILLVALASAAVCCSISGAAERQTKSGLSAKLHAFMFDAEYSESNEFEFLDESMLDQVAAGIEDGCEDYGTTFARATFEKEFSQHDCIELLVREEVSKEAIDQVENNF